MKIGEIEKRFDSVARDYERHDVLEREISERLIHRATFVRRQPTWILDLGCGTGRSILTLRSRFGEAQIVGLDVSGNMLRNFQRRANGQAHVFGVQGDLTRLPFAAQSADLVFSNLALQWAGDFELAMKEIREVLRPGGMLLFSVPGAGSLREFRHRSDRGGSQTIPVYMPDLQDVGDLLLSAGFTEPVMDCELITLHYPNARQMNAELAVTGGAGFAEMPGTAALDEAVELSFEVVYGAAFGPRDR